MVRHLQRMPDARWPRKIWNWKPIQHRKRGRPWKTWKNEVETAMTKRQLEEGDWLDKNKWRLGCDRRPTL